MERLLEYCKDDNDYNEQISEDHAFVIDSYVGKLPGKIESLQQKIRKLFGVELLFMNVRIEIDDDKSTYVPMTWLHTPVDKFKIMSNVTKRKEEKGER